MNPEQLLNSVEECIRERPKLDAKLWVICWHEDRLKCLPKRGMKDNGNIFGTFHVDKLNAGLTCDEWCLVARKIAIFFRIKNECQKLPKL